MTRKSWIEEVQSRPDIDDSEQQEALACLEAVRDGQRSFAELMNVVGRLGRRDKLGPLIPSLRQIGDSYELDRWIGSAASLLPPQGDDLERTYRYGESLQDRYDLQFFLDAAEIPSRRELAFDEWNEHLLDGAYHLYDRNADPVAHGIPRSHWWWFPEFLDRQAIAAAGSFGGLRLSAGWSVAELVASAEALSVDTPSSLAFLVGTRARDMTLADREGQPSAAAACLSLARSTVANGLWIPGRDSGRFLFTNGRTEIDVKISDDVAHIADLRPRARVVLDPNPPGLQQSLELLDRAHAAAPYEQRRLLVTEFMDRLGSIARVAPDQLSRHRQGLLEHLEDVNILSGWQARAERRRGDAIWFHVPAQAREDRSAIQFLLEMAQDTALEDQLADMRALVEYWDNDLRDRFNLSRHSEPPPLCPPPPGTPADHWWWDWTDSPGT